MRRSSHPALAASLLAFSLIVRNADAMVCGTTLRNLVTVSDTIVVGRVTEIRDLVGVRVGRVVVSETLKGSVRPEIWFLAQPTWACDISGGKAGASYLLFLYPYTFDPSPEPPSDPAVTTNVYREPAGFKEALSAASGAAPFFEITWAGRGQMELRLVEAAEYVTLWTGDVRLPRGIRTIDGPEPESASFIRSAPASDLLEFVRRRASRTTRALPR